MGLFKIGQGYLHLKDSKPKVKLEGEEASAKTLSIRENAGFLEIYDEDAGSRVPYLHGIYLVKRDNTGTVQYAGTATSRGTKTTKATNTSPTGSVTFTPLTLTAKGNFANVTLTIKTNGTLNKNLTWKLYNEDDSKLATIATGKGFTGSTTTIANTQFTKLYIKASQTGITKGTLTSRKATIQANALTTLLVS